MALRTAIVLLVVWVVMFVLYIMGTILENTTGNALINGPYGSTTPGLGAFISSINIEWQAGMTLLGFMIIFLMIAHVFQKRPESGRL